MKTSILMIVALSVAGFSVAHAQQPVYPQDDVYYGYYGGWGTYHHASTWAEGSLRGMGDLIRSAGRANLDHSAAAINWSLARRYEIENRKLWTDTYFQMRQANAAYRAAEAGPPPTLEDLIRYAEAGKPKRLSPGELDPVSGTIRWPVLLMSEPLADERAQVQNAFAVRAAQSVLGAEDYMMVRAHTRTMLEELSKQIAEVPAYQYMLAKRFIVSLAYEAGLPAI